MFKRVLALALGFLFLGTIAYAAQATVTKVEGGWLVTGGTDETLVQLDRIRVHSISYSAATAANVAEFRSGAVSGPKWYMKSAGVSGVNQCYIYYGEMGVVFDSLSVKLSQAEDVIQIY